MDPASTLAQVLTQRGIFRSQPFTLIDVGCSGGLFDPANAFLPDLRAVGFDPIEAEVTRLRASRSEPSVIFECALVGDPDWQQPSLRDSPGVYARSSAALFGQLHSFDYGTAINNAGQPITLTDTRVDLQSWLGANPEWRVDLLKVDTDGTDISVLRSMGSRLSEPLAVHIEVNFDGDPGPASNTFSTVFDVLVEAGFRLFALEPSRYTKASLPGVFLRAVPAQTQRGQVMQADALFCKDLAVEGDDDVVRILKLACIFDLLDLQDCAAELVEAHEQRISAVVSPASLLEQLGSRTEVGLSPRDARALLATKPQAFFPLASSAGSSAPESILTGAHDGYRGEVVMALDGRPVSLATGIQRTAACVSGWWSAEESGSWMAGETAQLQLVVHDPVPAGSVLRVEGWRLPPPDGNAELAIVVNGIALLRTDTSDLGAFDFVLPRSLPAGPWAVTFHCWPLVRPSETSVSEDSRQLGMHVRSVALLSGGH